MTKRDPLAELIASETVKNKRYSLSMTETLYKEIMELADEISQESGQRVSATKVIGGCVKLYKLKRAEK